ncbi:MAG: ABC transporter ATP-binding protein [Actinomycetota bacterium]
MSADPVIVAQDLAKRYGRSGRGLDGVSLTVGRGETFALLGPNGAGKTTFVKCLLGLLRPTGGSITVFGHPAASIGAREGVGFVPESPRFADFLSAQEVLRMHGRLIGLAGTELQQQIDYRLAAADLTDAPKRVKAFSKGMVRRLALAQALLGSPRLVVLDEPTADLDPLGRRAVRDQMAELKAAGATIVLNSHLLLEVERLCDHVAIMNKGKLLATGPIDQVVPEGTDLETVFVDMVNSA